jgi:hypothetical protein
MDKLNKAVTIMAKIAEVIHWIGAAAAGRYGRAGVTWERYILNWM